ncbi:adenylyl cyclase-associated protein [Sarocladium implicatum]|nr:adenylyl cyclase-associated protein [Sarocladium implicatum]
MANSSMHNLTTLIKRLEAATSRLEDIATSTELPKDVPALKDTILSPPAASTPQPTAAPTPPPAAEELPESIEDFDNFLNSSVERFVKLSNEIGGVVAKQAAEVAKGFKEQRKFLVLTTKAKKPDIKGSEMAVLQNILKPINDAVMTVTELKDTNRPDPKYNHLSTVADGIMLLGWVMAENKPHKMVDDARDSAQFFGNKISKEFKGKDQKQIDWLQAFYQIFRDLSDLTKQHFSNGIPWNPKGEPAQVVAKSLASSPSGSAAPTPGSGAPPPPPPAGGAPPPPPPPGPPPKLEYKEEPKADSGPSGLNAVFSELNKGDAVTKGLRKVDKSEMTHKNPSLRASSTVTDGGATRAKSPAPGKKPKPESMRVKKPAKKELDGNKWTIENYEKEPEPIEIDATLTQSVLISRCNNTTVIIRGKANQVTVENSTRLSLVVESLVSTVDVVKASNFALQVLGVIPTVMLDQVDGGQIYFSKDSSSTQVFTSKSAGINLNIISGPDDDYKEVPLPSQICSFYDEAKGELVNEIVAHAG